MNPKRDYSHIINYKITTMHYDISIILLAPYAILGAWIAINVLLTKRGN